MLLVLINLFTVNFSLPFVLFQFTWTAIVRVLIYEFQHLLGPLAAPDMIPGGLLHDTPPAYAHILKLVQECSEPMDPSGRFRAAQELTRLLAEVLQKHSYNV
jgi:hypothetical protein